MILEWLGAEEAIKLSASSLWAGPQLRKPWVAEIVGVFRSGKLDRRFLDGSKEYRSSNSAGSRGINLCFVLETDSLYEVKMNVSWRRSVNYFCAVTILGGIKELSEIEVREWLSAL